MKALPKTKSNRKSRAAEKPGDRTIVPFSVHSLRREHGTVFIKQAFVAGRIVYPVGERVRRHRPRERAIRREANRLIGEIGVPEGAPEIALVTIVPDRHGHLNLVAAERITLTALEGERRGLMKVVVAVGAALFGEEKERLSRRLKLPDVGRLRCLSEDHRTVVEVAASLLETTWRAAA